MECEESRIRRTFVFAPAVARSSCRSSGVAGWAIRKTRSIATATRWRVTKPITLEDFRFELLMIFPLERDLCRQGPDLDVGDERLRVGQDGIGRVGARRADLVGVHVLRLQVPHVDPAAAVVAASESAGLLDGHRQLRAGPAGEEAAGAMDVARQAEEDRSKRAAGEPGRELVALHEGLRVQHLDAGP